MSFSEDAADFINADTPGYVLATIGGATVAGLFDKEQVDIQIGFSGMEARRPSFICATALVSAIAQGASVIIGGTTYTVGNNYNDGTLLTTLELKA